VFAVVKSNFTWSLFVRRQPNSVDFHVAMDNSRSRRVQPEQVILPAAHMRLPAPPVVASGAASATEMTTRQRQA